MWIKRLRVTNYSSFSDSSWCEFGPGLNVVIGQNNVGKSALLKSLVYPLDDTKHRNEVEWREQFLPISKVEFDVGTSGPELAERIIQTGQEIQIPAGGPSVADEHAVQPIWDANAITMEVMREAGQRSKMRRSIVDNLVPNKQYSLHYQGRQGTLAKVKRSQGSADTTGTILDLDSSEFLYYFGPQRLNIGRSRFGANTRLRPTADNLPAILFHLQGTRRPLFDRLGAHLKRVIPSIQAISVAPHGDTECEIRTWASSEAAEPELGFALQESGTGISQVLAMLTAIMTVRQTVIVIDEISSFLNPSAVKTLIGIVINEYPQHQYIISTHSTEALTTIEPDTVHLVSKSGYESEVKKTDIRNVADLRLLSDEVGFSMMDVFGADRICWVEGQSEEACFPMVRSAKDFDLSPKFAAIRSPDIISGKNRKRQPLIALFERVIRTVSPLTRGCSFGIDREELSDQAVAGIVNWGRGRVLVLPRRNLECYLIDQIAIAEVISSECGIKIAPAKVEEVLLSLGSKAKFHAEAQFSGDLKEIKWLSKVDGAKLLTDAFAQISDHTLEFRKVKHSPKLLKLILERDGEIVKELADYVERLVAAAKRDW